MTHSTGVVDSEGTEACLWKRSTSSPSPGFKVERELEGRLHWRFDHR